MLYKYVVVVTITTAGAITPATAQQPCDFRLALCPSDMHCVTEHSELTDINQYKGTCEFKNEYTACGVDFTPPVNCEPGFECFNDPRLPEHRDLAFEKLMPGIPGICVPEDRKRCGGGFFFRNCPEGLTCYKPHGLNAQGLCL